MNDPCLLPNVAATALARASVEQLAEASRDLRGLLLPLPPAAPRAGASRWFAFDMRLARGTRTAVVTPALRKSTSSSSQYTYSYSSIEYKHRFTAGNFILAVHEVMKPRFTLGAQPKKVTCKLKGMHIL